MRNNPSTLFTLVGLSLLAACSHIQPPNQELAKSVDIDQFMGTWYVHGYTPTAIDKNAWNATESYERLPNGKIQTTYVFRKGSANGKPKTYKPVGTVVNTDTNAEWRMRFFGILSAAYYILSVDSDYKYTVIGHPNKKYAWIMSRNSSIPENKYASLVDLLEAREYDLSNFKRMPHE